MRILVSGTVGESIPPPYGGIPKISLIWARKWREKGHQVAFTWAYNHEKEDDLGAKAKYYWEFSHEPKKINRLFFLIKYFLLNPILYFRLLLIYRKFHGFIKKEGIIYPAFGVFLDRVISDFKPDVIILETALVKSFIASFLAKRRSIPFIIKTYAEVHDLTMTPNKFFNNDEKKLRAYWTNFLTMAEKVVGASYYCELGPAKYLGKDKLTMIYSTALDVAVFEEKQKEYSKSEARKKLNIPENLFMTLSVGAFTPRKGHDHIIKAVGKLAKQGKRNFGVALCGAGEPNKWLELAKEEGVSDQLFIFRKLSEEDLMKLYKASDVYIDASNTVRACLGMALTEGLATCLPSIAYDAGGLPESVVENYNGYLVPLDDISALAEAIKKMSEIPKEERIRFGENGFKRAREIFDVNVIADQFLNLIESIVK